MGAGPTPKWCLDRWCYVAPWNCHKPHSASLWFTGAVMANRTLLEEGGIGACTEEGVCGDDPALMYSYETCGNVETFQVSDGRQAELDEVARRGPIRLTFTGDDSPYIKQLGPNETRLVPGTDKDGSVVKFITDLLLERSVTWKEVPITGASRDYSSSSFQACIHDVALNATDLCVGSTWAFENRRRLVDFTGDITASNLRLLVKLQSSDYNSFSQKIKQPFAPFTAKMWLALVGALIYIGYAMYTLDASGYESDDQNEDGDDALGQALYKRRTGNDISKLTDKQRERATKEVAHMKKVVKCQQKWRAAFLPTTRDDWNDLGISVMHAFRA